MTEANTDSQKRLNNVNRKGADIAPGLYLVATPIGNLRDITLRALDVLAGVDLILAEDTRHSRRLLDRYGISTKMRPYHQHNASTVRAGVIQALTDGQSIALISDAGTPLVSDPGFKLVQAAVAANICVIPIPGASAILTAISAAALPVDKFLFAGFAPAKSAARKTFFQALVAVPASLVFFESPNRIVSSLRDMLEVFGPRPAVLARELTKIHETFLRQSLPDLIENLQEKKIRGECVIVVGPMTQNKIVLDAAQIDTALLDAIQRAGVKAAAREVAQISGQPMRQLYARALTLKQEIQ